jgi:subtilisin family serine protease
MKPDAPENVRGKFKPIRTNATGVQICEHFPLMARMMNKVSLIRSLHHRTGATHENGQRWMMTGHDFNADSMKPHCGSVVSRMLGQKSELPANVILPSPIGNTGAGPLVAAMNQAVNYATSKGVLVVVSAGNNAIDMDHAGSVTNVPAQSGSAIAISATGPLGYAVGWPAGNQDFDRPASYTNYGNSLVWVAAPGGDFALPGTAICSIPRCCGGPAVTTQCWVHDMVMSTVRGSGVSISSYGWAAGTSMASPAVAGLAALILERFPGMTVGDLKNHIKNTADGVAGNDPLHPYYGHGFVNAYRALTEGGSASQAIASPNPKAESAAAARASLSIGSGSIPEISFTMPAAGPARVDLYDVAGRRVAVLFSGTAGAGRTVLSWDGRDSNGFKLGHGTYFARFMADDVTMSRKFVKIGE